MSKFKEDVMAIFGLRGVTVSRRETSTGKSGATMMAGLQRVSVSPMGVLPDKENALAMEGL